MSFIMRLLLLLLLIKQINCQINQLQLFNVVGDKLGIFEDEDCTQAHENFFNMTQKILQIFCKIDSVGDMLSFKSGQIEACCKVDEGILNNNCFDPCIQQENASSPVTILTDLWRTICRFKKQECLDPSPPNSNQQEQQQLQKQSQSTGIIDVVSVPLIPLLGEVPGFSFLLYYLNKAGILKNMQDNYQSFTLFAPTNSAFIKFAEQYSVESTLLDESIPNWAQILKYHLILGVHRLDEIQQDRILNTYSGSVLVVRASKEAGVGLIQSCCVIESMAEVMAQDFLVSEGILHAIDTLLIPQKIKL